MMLAHDQRAKKQEIGYLISLAWQPVLDVVVIIIKIIIHQPTNLVNSGEKSGLPAHLSPTDERTASGRIGNVAQHQPTNTRQLLSSNSLSVWLA